MDVFSPSKRSEIMRKIKSFNTRPEMIVRQLLHRSGYRYRLHNKKLPGSPDLVFANRKKVIFVHGCYWHRHLGCKYATCPSTNIDYWNNKFQKNIARDINKQKALKQLGWDILVIWECQTKDYDYLKNILLNYLK